MLNVPSTSPIPLLYGEGRAARTRNQNNPTDLGGSFFVQFQSGIAQTTAATKSSQLYVTPTATQTPLTGNGTPYPVQPNNQGSSLLISNGALAYSGLWNTSPFIGTQATGGFPGSVIRGKFYGLYTITGTPVMNFEVGVIQNTAAGTYTALSAMSPFTWATLPTAQPWETVFELVVNNNLTTTATAGSGFTATVNTNAAGVVTSITVTNAGSGYVGLPTLAISGVGAPSVNATLYPVLSPTGGILAVQVVSGGLGYTASQTGAGSCAATATAGSIYARGSLTVGGVAGAAATVFEFAPASTTIDTTLPYWIDIRSTFSTAASMTVQGGYLEFLN